MSIDREELANKVFDALRADMQLIHKTDEELWRAIAETDDISLLTWLENE